MVRLILTSATFMAFTALGHADDWPQWMGPGRDNVWKETGIIDKFPAGGPKILWRSPVAARARQHCLTVYCRSCVIPMSRWPASQFACWMKWI